MTLLTDNEIRRIEKRLETDANLECKETMIMNFAMYKTCLLKMEQLTPELKEYGLMPRVV